MRWSCYILVIATLAIVVSAQRKLRLCVQDEVTPDQCNAVERADSPVKCERVVDSAECAIKIAEDRADFGLFTAEELLLNHRFYPTGAQVVAELKHVDRSFEQFEFQSVVIVPKSYVPSEGGFGALVGSGLCHPGFSQTQMWNDHVLKYFEKKVMNNVCRNDVTAAENEIINIRDFFKKGCRPGPWVADTDAQFNQELKNKYPELCELCDNQEQCRYSNPESHGHKGALDCLTSGRGKVAYVSLQIVRDYFADCIQVDNETSVMYKSPPEPNSSSKKRSDYQFLCENGTVMPLDSPNPCTWFKKPWNAILARETSADQVLKILDLSSKVAFSQPWEFTLRSILQRDDQTMFLYNNYTSPAHYLSRGWDLELPSSECNQEIRWCTVNELEQNKCQWVAGAASILGIKPIINCVAAKSPFECFNMISNNEADIIAIDSNYGHLARKVYGLGPIVFCETSADRNSFVVAAIRDKAHVKRITSLAEVKDSNACFPEYGGIAWLSFINVARERGVLPDSCKYPHIVANLLQSACTPGFVEANHSPDKKRRSLSGSDNLGKLCDLCPQQLNGERCEANSENAYYGDKGALDCLKLGVGDIAFLEARNIRPYINNGSVNASEFRVLCKNGTLAEYTGFDVDGKCALSVTIDSEVVTKRDRPKHQLKDATLLMLKIENWLGYRGDSQRRAVHVYDPFNRTENLLFKDSTTGLVTIESNVESVSAYKDLFRHVDACSSALSVVAVLALVMVNFIAARLI